METTPKQASDRPYLSIIMPMYNEEGGIVPVIESLLALFPAQIDCTFEIVIVDDGSSDQSAQQVQAFNHPRVKLYQHPYNIGNGGAIKTGIRRARGEIMVMLDADGQHKAEDIPRLLEHLGPFDMVVGARTAASDTDWHRDLANTLYNWFATYVSGRKIEDLTSGFRAIKAPIARGFVSLLPNSFSYPTTITLATIRSGYALKYIPIQTVRRVGKSKIKLFRDGTRFLLIILRIATLFSPLKVFLPVSVGMFLLGFGYGLFKVVVLGSRYGPTSAMLMTIAVVVFLIGLVSEQITQMRFDRIDIVAEGSNTDYETAR